MIGSPEMVAPSAPPAPTVQRYYFFYPFGSDGSAMWSYYRCDASPWLQWRKPGSEIFASNMAENCPPTPLPGNDVRDRLHVACHGGIDLNGHLVLASDGPWQQTITPEILGHRLAYYLGKAGRSLLGLPIKLDACNSAVASAGQQIGQILYHRGYRDFKIIGYRGLVRPRHCDYNAAANAFAATTGTGHRYATLPDGPALRMSRVRQVLYETGSCPARPTSLFAPFDS
jgi:hypothetical protein